jgi:photosystem II stability/assembly factor-like uncharacterized protein
LIDIPGDALSLLADPTSDLHIFSRSNDEYVRRSSDGGLTSATTTVPGSGFWNHQLAYHPATTTLYTGTELHGVYKSTNDGVSFFPANVGIESFRVRCLALAPGSDQVLYTGSFSDGLYKTTTGGTSWTHLTSFPEPGALVIAVTPSGNRVYAGTPTGVYMSADGGNTWTPKNVGLPATKVVSELVVDASCPCRLYAGLGYYQWNYIYGGGVYQSTDGGDTWAPLTTGSDSALTITALKIDPLDRSRLHIATYGSGARPVSGHLRRLPMSVRGLRPFLLLVGSLLAICTDAQIKTRPCELPQAQSKIPVLVLDQKAKTPERAAEHWRRALRHKGRYFPLEITAYPGAENLRATGAGSLLELGVRSGSALVLARDDSKQWLAVIEPRANDSFGFPVPTATRVREKEVKQFVRSFAQYFSGDYGCALEGFMMLESKRDGAVGGGEVDFWIGSMLARLGQGEEAARRLRQAAVSNDAGAEEIKLASALALAQLLLPRAPYDPGVARETLVLLEDAARGLRETDGRYWVASQAALGRYWLALSGTNSAEGLRRARLFRAGRICTRLPAR